jgi:CsoR family transcriptional regulator, copper-sensing transcriptional repressor
MPATPDDSCQPADPLSAERKAELMHRLRRAEGQVRGLQKLLETGADCSKIAQQLLATRHALDSTYVRLNLSVAERELSKASGGAGDPATAVGEVLDRLQQRLGRSR